MTTENQPLRKSAAELRDALSLLEKAAKFRRLAAFQTNRNIKATLLGLAVEYELRADQMAGNHRRPSCPESKLLV
jgi:hypothetical protein